MPSAVNLLSDITSSPDWSPVWMTIEEIAAELDRRGLWKQRPFRRFGERERLDFLESVLGGNSMGEGSIWMRMGSRFKHNAILTDDDQTLLQDWNEARRVDFDEDLSRILLGEPPLWRNGTRAPATRFRDLLRQARPLVEELSAYVQYEFTDEDDQLAQRETPPVARRIEELAVALTSLFDRSAEQSTTRK
jgi:hypothetical protein